MIKPNNHPLYDDPRYRETYSAVVRLYRDLAERMRADGHLIYAPEPELEAEYVLSHALSRFVLGELVAVGHEFQDENGHYCMEMFSRPFGDD